MMRVVVIGGGPGGYVSAIRFAQLGADVSLIDNHKIGGTCLNYGCIPTKTLFEDAQIVHKLREQHAEVLTFDNFQVNDEALFERMVQVKTDLVSGVEKLLDANRVDVIKGHARLDGDHKISIETEEGTHKMSYDALVIASGSKARKGPDHARSLTSRDLITMGKLPKSLTIVGGGVIGLEFATIYQALGVDVTLLNRDKFLLKSFDTDVTKRLQSYVKKQGVKLYMGTEIATVDEVDDGVKITTKGKHELTYETEYVLYAIGRVPNLMSLNLDENGVEYTNRGIKYDEHFMTNVKDVYAIGDVIGRMQLAHVASHQGIYVAEHVMGIHTDMFDYDKVPSCIFVMPNIAKIGKSEVELQEDGKENRKDYHVSKFNFQANGKALAMGESQGFIKIIGSEQGILGVQIIGPGAAELIHQSALMMHMGLNAKDLSNIVYAHPTLSEAFLEAGLGLTQRAIHKVNL